MHGSITAAARSLGYTQSAVSRQIAALEASIGGRLLDRHARGVELTERGRCLLVHADAVLRKRAIGIDILSDANTAYTIADVAEDVHALMRALGTFEDRPYFELDHTRERGAPALSLVHPA